MERIQIVDTDITQLKVDAIVNAAKNSLLGGGNNERPLLASCYRQSLETES